ncbi:alpha/beta hydrolase [Candidatus Solirubrobacter pratensis]|uniref:alpha/beta hydrolase n=1 Tax=Candidatus Solirubrobacter pratensis TaxID=1298857 RepID=UPI00040C3A76|nr:alpha/beta hydrolase [Candidatus Solirubrobacter pratensis]
MPRASRLLPCLTVAALLALAPRAGAAQHQPLQWSSCGSDSVARVTCADYKVPRDYDAPAGPQFTLHVAKSPATDPQHRVGSLFLNFGGPGAPMAVYLEVLGADLFPELNKRFDLIGVDPRGVGESKPAVDCVADEQIQGLYSQPFVTPFTAQKNDLVGRAKRYIQRCIDLNPGALPYLSTANVARDFDTIRAAQGERKLNYLGFSYGTFLGATYASLFPTHYRAMVLDGPVDADRYINDPLEDTAEQTAGFERAFGRFLQACAAHQDRCHGFGGDDPESAFDRLAAQLDATPLPATGYKPDPKPVDGDDLRAAASSELYSTKRWDSLAVALAMAQGGDGSGIRQLVDEDFYERDPQTGEYDPLSDRFFLITAAEQRYPRDLDVYMHDGAQSWSQNEDFWFNNGYVEMNDALFPIRAQDAYTGPFRIPKSAQTPLVVATTYDPATPYRGAQRLVADLGNARLLTMNGDGHTAYQTGSPDCVDTGIESYLATLMLPAAGTVCRQAPPFATPAQPQTLSARKLRRLPAPPFMR